MNSNDEPDRVFPLDAPATRLEAFRAARLGSALKPAPASLVMGNGAFIRSWVGRRLKASSTIANAGAQTCCAQNGDDREGRTQQVCAPTELRQDRQSFA